jgi:hypothetical protein
VAMAFATNVDRFIRLKGRAPPRLLTYLQSMEDSKWAKCMHRVCMGGQMSSSVSDRLESLCSLLCSIQSLGVVMFLSGN